MTRVLADHSEILSMRQKIQQLESEKAELIDGLRILKDRVQGGYKISVSDFDSILNKLNEKRDGLSMLYLQIQ